MAKAWPGGGIARDHLAGVDAGADGELDVVIAPQLAVQVGERGAQIGSGRADRPERVVVVDRGDAEDRHDRVADELLDRPAVPLEHGARHLEVARHHPLEDFRIEPFPSGVESATSQNRTVTVLRKTAM